MLAEEAGRLLRNPGVYADCRLSVDSEDDGAQRLRGRLQSYRKRFAELAEPLSQLLDRAPEDVVEAWLADEKTAPARFSVEHSRKAASRAPEPRGGDARRRARRGRHPRLGAPLHPAFRNPLLRGDGRKRAAHHGARGGERSDAEAGRCAPRERMAGHQRGVGGARRVLRRRNQRHRRLASRDVPEAVARRPVRALPRRPPAPQPHLAGHPGHDL